MSDGVICDNCDKVADLGTEDDETLWWMQIGWREGHRFDICSPSCAVEMVSTMEQQRVEIEAQTEAESA